MKNIHIMVILAVLLSVSCSVGASARWHTCAKMRAAIGKAVTSLISTLKGHDIAVVETVEELTPVAVEIPMPVACTRSPRQWLFEDDHEYQIFDLDGPAEMSIRIKECRHYEDRSQLIASYFWNKTDGRQLQLGNDEDRMLIEQAYAYEQARVDSIVEAERRAEAEKIAVIRLREEYQVLCISYEKMYKLPYPVTYAKYVAGHSMFFR
ncbi:hypothetical protein FJ365_04870 [Candidatus Dependentiae bacterium]|nr:hypothetical protein [Candidatus Dependentiae bacterium]